MVIVSHADELEVGPPEEVALENAFRKARTVADGLAAGTLSAPGASAGADAQEDPLPGSTREDPLPGSAIVLGVDTVVALGATVYGKPADRPAAQRTLSALSGRTHRVISGVCLIEGDRVRTAAAVTTVTFRRLDAATLGWYLDTGEWRDRAGAYAIQARGAGLVTEIAGDYLNVVGLPVPTLLELVPDLLQ